MLDQKDGLRDYYEDRGVLGIVSQRIHGLSLAYSPRDEETMKEMKNHLTNWIKKLEGEQNE